MSLHHQLSVPLSKFDTDTLHLKYIYITTIKLLLVLLHCESKKGQNYFYLMQFILSDTYSHNILLTQQQLPVMCEICCEFFILALTKTTHVSAKQCVNLNVRVSHFRLLKKETSTFISSRLWLQHPDLNPVNYKFA